MALWGHPEFVVLDEPTTGLDPQSRRTMWRIIRDLVSGGSAVLLTTHYLEEAQNLAETVTILDQGTVALEGSMEQVLASIPATIDFTVETASEVVCEFSSRLKGSLEAHPGTSRIHVGIRTTDLQGDVGRVVDWARGHELTIGGLRSSPASLEEVFLEVSQDGTGPQLPSSETRRQRA